MKKRSLIQLLAALLCFALVLSACGSGSPAASSNGGGDAVNSAGGDADADADAGTNEEMTTQEVVEGDIHDLLVVAGMDPTMVNPNNANNDSVIMSVYETLFQSMTFGSEMEPLLADGTRGEFGGYDHEEGTTVYTVYLKDYVYDSAGNHITASDVAFSYNNKVADGWASTLQNFWGEDAVALDDTTIQFTFTKELTQVGDLENAFAFTWIYSEDAWNNSADGFASEACGTGRYRLVEYVAGNHMTVELRDDYWETDESKIAVNQQAYYQTVREDFITEDSVKTISLDQGDLNVAMLSATSFANYANNDNFNTYTFNDNRLLFLVSNCSEDSIMNDINMRLAVYNAIDLDALEAFQNGTFARAYSSAHAGYPLYSTDWENWDNYNTRKNGEGLALVDGYLEAAGYQGETVKVFADDQTEGVMTVVLSQLQNAGINAQLTVLQGSALDEVFADSTQWDVGSGMVGSSNTIANIFNNEKWDTRKTNTGMTQGFIKDDELQAAVETMMDSETFSQESVENFLHIVYDNAYTMCLGYNVNNYVLSKNIQSMTLNSRNWPIYTAFPWVD